MIHAPKKNLSERNLTWLGGLFFLFLPMNDALNFSNRERKSPKDVNAGERLPPLWIKREAEEEETKEE